MELRELDDHHNYADSLSYHAVSNAIAGSVCFKIVQHFNIQDRYSKFRNQRGILETRINALHSSNETANGLRNMGYTVNIFEESVNPENSNCNPVTTQTIDNLREKLSYINDYVDIALINFINKFYK